MITFELDSNRLFLKYEPERVSDEYVYSKLHSEDGYRIRGTFHLYAKNLLNYPDIDSFIFQVGNDFGEYIKLDKDILETKHNFYFSKEIEFKSNLFITYNNISILNKIDELIEKDLFIGGNWDEKDGISFETYKMLIKTFPNSTEIKKYAHMRISYILKEYFSECNEYESLYKKYIERKNSQISTITLPKSTIDFSKKIKLEHFILIYNELKYLIDNSISINEGYWQKKISDIIKMIYPQYILSKREITIKGIDKYNKRPDFILVDTNGFVDILEIKKPETPLLTNQNSYRNNYVPVKDLSGTIQQIEKYICCLTKWGENGENDLQNKFSNDLPQNVKINILNPKGILLIGKSSNFNKQQNTDFEIIKRQYKNIAEIITYDDLLSRLKNIISSLRN